MKASKQNRPSVADVEPYEMVESKVEIASKPDLALLLRKLEFTAEGVAEAALESASLFEMAARYRVDKMRLRSAAEMNMDRVRADCELAIRKEAADNGDKITEGNIKARLIIDEKVEAATKQFNDAEANEEYGKLLVESYRIRRDSLKSIVDLTGAERALQQYMESSQAKLQETRKQLQVKYPKG